MIGANVVFHLVSAIAAVFLLVLIVRLRGQRDTLRHLLGLPAHKGRKVVLLEPGQFVRQICAAAGIPFEMEGHKGQLQRIELAAWRELFSSWPVSLIRWKAGETYQQPVSVFIFLSGMDPHSSGQLATQLTASLGEGIEVKVLQESDQ